MSKIQGRLSFEDILLTHLLTLTQPFTFSMSHPNFLPVPVLTFHWQLLTEPLFNEILETGSDFVWCKLKETTILAFLGGKKDKEGANTLWLNPSLFQCLPSLSRRIEILKWKTNKWKTRYAGYYYFAVIWISLNISTLFLCRIFFWWANTPSHRFD